MRIVRIFCGVAGLLAMAITLLAIVKVPVPIILPTFSLLVGMIGIIAACVKRRMRLVLSVLVVTFLSILLYAYLDAHSIGMDLREYLDGDILLVLVLFTLAFGGAFILTRVSWEKKP